MRIVQWIMWLLALCLFPFVTLFLTIGFWLNYKTGIYAKTHGPHSYRKLWNKGISKLFAKIPKEGGDTHE